MVSSTKVNQVDKVEVPTYPRLMISKHTKAVLLMTSDSAGTVVYSDDEGYPIGRHSDNWIPIKFKKYHGEVHLKAVYE